MHFVFATKCRAIIDTEEHITSEVDRAKEMALFIDQERGLGEELDRMNKNKRGRPYRYP